MSLVTYDLSGSDESEEETMESPVERVVEVKKREDERIEENLNGLGIQENGEDEEGESATTMFGILPKPKNFEVEKGVVEEEEEEEDVAPVTEVKSVEKKPVKKTGRVQITVPSLSEFRDVKDNEPSKLTAKPAQKNCSLFSLLPPPKSQMKSKSLVPQQIANKSSIEIKRQPLKAPAKPNNTPQKIKTPSKIPTLLGANYESDSEDDDETHKSAPSATRDFFSLASTKEELSPAELAKLEKETEKMTNSYLMKQDSASKKTDEVWSSNQYNPTNDMQTDPCSSTSKHMEVQNDVEIGPKPMVPEQTYNLDADGNIALDDKAIEYLCGKRGIKRKNEELKSANIIEINGEDIKPDEREWLVKALTENPIHRPISLGAGPSGQSKKKHQITYLAHQAKAMELELQNQWSQNRMTRQQTQSKYGF